MRTLGSEPKPNHMTNSGATATTGVTLTRMAIGSRLRSRKRECAISVAPMNAAADPSAKPPSASASVMPPCSAK